MKQASPTNNNSGAARNRVSILIATDTRTDADTLRKLLGTDFGEIVVSRSADTAATDFEEHEPRVLLLAFNSLAKAQHYCFGLYRFSGRTHDLPHRTLILCTKDEVNSVYALCEKEFFDDYVLFWPLSHDGPRLKMSVRLALRYLDAAEQSASAAQLARQARRIASLESTLATAQAELDNRIGEFDASRQAAVQQLGDAIDAFSDNVASGRFDTSLQVGDLAAFTAQAQRFRDERVADAARASSAASAPIRAWNGELTEQIKPHLDAVRGLQSLAARVRTRILVIEDDEMQFKLLSAQLATEPYELDWAPNAEAAFRLLTRRTPDLILLDVDLPDLAGPDVLRQVRKSELHRQIPVLMVSSHSARPIVVDAIEAGAVGFMVKPVEKSLLVQRLAAALAQQPRPPGKSG
ncbi:MAG: response regulator [Lautropia sp.]